VLLVLVLQLHVDKYNIRLVLGQTAQYTVLLYMRHKSKKPFLQTFLYDHDMCVQCTPHQVPRAALRVTSTERLQVTAAMLAMGH